jgi:hypothetical protein
VRLPALGLATVALLAVMAAESTAHADEPSATSASTSSTTEPIEGSDALRVTGHTLLIGGGLAMLPAAYTAGTVAVGAFEPGGAERASKDFQEPFVFVPLAAGFVAVMVGAALLVIVNPPTETPTRAKRSTTASTTWATPFAFTF